MLYFPSPFAESSCEVVCVVPHPGGGTTAGAFGFAFGRFDVGAELPPFPEPGSVPLAWFTWADSSASFAVFCEAPRTSLVV